MTKKIYKIGIHPLFSQAFQVKVDKEKIKDSKKLFCMQTLCLTICCLINMSACFNREANEALAKNLVLAEVFLFISLTIFEIILVFNYEKIKNTQAFLHFYRNYSFFMVALVLVVYSETEFCLQEIENNKLNYGSLNLFFSFVLFTFLSCVASDTKKKVMTACLLILYLQVRKFNLYQRKDFREIIIENFMFLLMVIFYWQRDITEKNRIETIIQNNYNLTLCSEILESLDIGVSIITKKKEYVYYNKYFQMHFMKNNSQSLSAFKTSKNWPPSRSLRSEIFRKQIKSKCNSVSTVNNLIPKIKNVLKQKSEDESGHEVSSSEEKTSFYQTKKSGNGKDFNEIVEKLLQSTKFRSLKSGITSKTKEDRTKSSTNKRSTMAENLSTQKSKNFRNFITVSKPLHTEQKYYINEKNNKKYDTNFNQIYFLQEPAVLVTSALFNPENDNKSIKTTEKVNSEILSDICNTIKTPINCFIFLLEYLTDDLIKKECQITQEFLHPTIGSLKIFEFNLKNIIDFHKLNKGDFKLVLSKLIISEIIQETAKLFEDSSDHSNLEFQITTQKDIPLVITSDLFRLKQVLINILNLINIKKGLVKIHVSSDNLMSEEKMLKIKVGFLSDVHQDSESTRDNTKSDNDFNFKISDLLVKQLNSRNFRIEQEYQSFSFYISDFSDKTTKDLKLEYTFNPKNKRQIVSKEEFSDFDSFEEDLGIKNGDILMIQKKNQPCKFFNSIDLEGQLYSNSFNIEEKSEEEERINFREISEEKETEDFSNVKNFNTNPKKCGCPDILIVEESTIHRFTIKLIFQKCGLIIDAVSDAFEAVEKISHRMENACCHDYKIIFADFMFISKIKEFFGSNKKLKSKLVVWVENNQSFSRKEGIDAVLDRSIDFSMIKAILEKYLF